jgi:mannose-6-phosphate isomerase-like protein (cupin superfamily)
MAERYGLVLLENGALVDTTLGQSPPADIAPMPVTDRAAIARLRRMRPEDENEVIARARHDSEQAERLVIGEGGELPPAQGFTVSRLTLKAGEQTPATAGNRPEVVFVQSGGAEVVTPEASLALEPGDTMTVPVGLPRAYCAADGDAELIVVRGTD